MSNEALQKKNIRILGCETKAMSNGKFMSKITGNDDGKYMLFHTKIDGTDTKAFAALKEMPMSGIGCDVEIVYKEDPYTKDGKEYKSKKVIGLTKIAPATEMSGSIDESITF